MRVVALCGRSHERAAAQAAKFAIARVVTDYREIMQMEDVDAVTISTPNVSHSEIAVAALKAGKHVFCEKPLAMSEQQAWEMYSLAEQSGLTHQVAFTFRHLHGLSLARRLVSEGVLGRIFHARFWTEGNWYSPDATIRWREQKHLAGAGILGDMGSHLIDMAHFLLGPLHSVYGRLALSHTERPDGRGGMAASDADDCCVAIGRFRSGIDGLFFMSWTSGGKSEGGIEIQGSEGTLKVAYSRGEPDRVELWRAGTGWRAVPLPDGAAPGHNQALYRMLLRFGDGMSGAPTGPAATFRDGYRAQVVQDAIEASSNSGQAVSVRYRDE
jgi:predicted dehydrogenase